MSQMVKVGSGVEVGAVTPMGTVTSKERVSVDRYSLTFDSGATRTFRFDQALAVTTEA